jgi:aminoacylase
MNTISHRLSFVVGWVDVTARGPTGHGSRFIDNTAVEQLVELANKALAFRQGQRELLGLHEHANCAHAVAAAAANKNKTTTTTTKTLGDVTSLNITTLQAGVRVGDTYAYNCVPPLAKCSLDIRISPHVDPATIGTMLDNWCTECSRGGPNTVTWNYIGGHGNDMTKHALTSTDPADNPWYRIFTDAIAELGIAVQPQVFPAATDSRFLRALGIRALGFSPMRQTEIMLHENDEYIPEATYLEGIGVYVNLIYRLAQADIP